MEECCICFQEFGEGDSTGDAGITGDVTLTCKHHFHKECLKKMYRCACPLCNAPITEPDDVVASIENNIYRKRQEEINQEQNFDLRILPFTNFLSSLLILVYDERLTGEKSQRYPLYYRFQESWGVIEHLTNLAMACSNMFQNDDWEDIIWSHDYDIERTAAQFNDNNELIAEYKFKISDILEQSDIAFTNIMDSVLYGEAPEEEMA